MAAQYEESYPPNEWTITNESDIRGVDLVVYGLLYESKGFKANQKLDSYIMNTVRD